jgi:hypothetical protein
MEEIEVPTDKAQDDINEHARESRERWISWVALSSALIAALAAVTALLAGHHANEGMIEQLQSSDRWAEFQAKGLDQKLFEVERNLLDAQGKTLSKDHAGKLEKYEEERKNLSEKAKEKGDSSNEHMSRHIVFARGVTMFQIAIAIAAIAVLTRRTWFWYVAMAFGALGLFFLIQGLWCPHMFDGAAQAAHGAA